MRIAKWMSLAALLGVVVAMPACNQATTDAAKKDTGAAIDATKAGADKAIEATRSAGEATADATRDAAKTTGDKTREVAGEIADKGKEVASATGEAVTDAWITTKVKAKFADENVLKGSAITVDTQQHVVGLRGTVGSDAAKERAQAIARGTERVTRVENYLVVVSK